MVPMERRLHASRRSQYKFILDPTLTSHFWDSFCVGGSNITFSLKLVLSLKSEKQQWQYNLLTSSNIFEQFLVPLIQFVSLSNFCVTCQCHDWFWTYDNFCLWRIDQNSGNCKYPHMFLRKIYLMLWNIRVTDFTILRYWGEKTAGKIAITYPD